MALVAHSSELSLFDLIQVKGSSRATCRIAVQVRDAAGVLFLRRGVVVYAAFGNSVGDEAAYAILRETQLDYHVTSDVIVPAPNMQKAHQELVLEAMHRLDEAARAPYPRLNEEVSKPTTLRTKPARQESASRGTRSRPGFGRTAIVASLVFVSIGALVVARGLVQQRPPPAPPPPPRVTAVSPPAVPQLPVDASTLRGPTDRLPSAVVAGPVPPPASTVPLRPTIVCRLLVDDSGNVTEAKVYQHRDGLDEFEKAALAAVKAYRFEPARREGTPVAVWINWPVEFRNSDLNP